MKVVITILGDDGLVLAEHTAEAAQPTQWRPAPGQQLLDGHYEINGFTYQPHVRSLRPNGYQDEMRPMQQPPYPVSGQTLSGQTFSGNQYARQAIGGHNPVFSIPFQQGPGLASPLTAPASPFNPGDLNPKR